MPPKWKISNAWRTLCRTSYEQLKVDLELIRKYNVPGPRYTSYPPAPQFTETDHLAGGRRENTSAKTAGPARGLSLYFHIPFCESLCWYCGCTTVITTQQQKAPPTSTTWKRKWS